MGLAAMHDLKIIHRDIKSDNICCKSNGEIKLVDLGISVCLTKEQAYRTTRGGIGTYNWISPDILLGHVYNEKIDVWSFGAFMYEIGTGGPPFMKKSLDYIAKESSLRDIICPN